MTKVERAADNKPPGFTDSGGLQQLLSFSVRCLNIVVSRDLDRKLSGLDVAKGTGKISTLLIVSRHPGIRPSSIADLIMRDRSSMGRLIDKMELQGLLRRKVAPDDNRSQALYLTEQGYKLASKVINLAQKQDRDFFHAISEQDKSLMINLCKKILNSHREQKMNYLLY
ncbi:MarR family transcriptional regulator [Erwiniaceae bacterium BAC15a-03b]|uniref:MarR family transcriptional regulator n=1 Tax=Winslowiella arboricola TaxID=2978220 RepID=A0A9J6PMR7_9GAMM|nr:MarR family transcriptional regulator [Winslowiella arboricola]MCU5774520.1 MarR family transcriptional regulator [Winslowiella arboricola]MCU5778070.1 MarR family transcriptional regulator [Winslowiella arboricola]